MTSLLPHCVGIIATSLLGKVADCPRMHRFHLSGNPVSERKYSSNVTDQKRTCMHGCRSDRGRPDKNGMSLSREKVSKLRTAYHAASSNSRTTTGPSILRGLVCTQRSCIDC